MYNFHKNQKTIDSKIIEFIDKVDINGEILDVEYNFNDKLQIKCKLKDIDSYIKDNNFPDTIGFFMDSSNNSFTNYITLIFLEKENDKFKAEFFISFSYESNDNKWSTKLFTQKFEETFEKYIINCDCKAEIEVENENEFSGAIIKFYFSELTCPQRQIKTFIDIVNDVYNKTDNELLNDALGVYSIKIPIDLRIKTSMKQYLTYFPEFIEKAKGYKISFEVRSEDDSLSIQVSKNNDLSLIDEYLKEYIGFIKQSIDSLNPEIKNASLRDLEKDLLVIELRSQINHLKTSVEIKNVEIKYLKENVERITGLLEDSIKSNTKNQITLLVDSHSSSVLTSNIDIDFNPQRELNTLQKELLELKEHISTPDGQVKDEIDKVDIELLQLGNHNVENIQNNKHIFDKLRTLLVKISDSNSKVNKTLDLTKEGLKKVQKLAKIYNQFAKWLILPQVPDIFLGSKDEKDS